MSESLVIVESPTKERTITKFLGKEFQVRSSYGHVRDLPPRSLGVDIKDDFAPSYVILPKAKKFLPDLTKLAKAAKSKKWRVVVERKDVIYNVKDFTFLN